MKDTVKAYNDLLDKFESKSMFEQEKARIIAYSNKYDMWLRQGRKRKPDCIDILISTFKTP